MQINKEAMIFIPGLDSSERNFNLRRLAAGFLNVPENARVEKVGESNVTGETGIQLRVMIDDKSEKIVDLFEANWWDLTVLKNEENSLEKVKQGISLLFYWFFSHVWRAIRKSPYMMLGIISSSFILALWYYGVLVLAFTAVGKNPEIITSSINNNWAPNLVDNIGKLGKMMGGWYIWAIASFLMGFLPVNSLVRISRFTKRYLRNEFVEDGIGLRDKIRNRVKETINNILKDGSYDKVTVLAHSFGTVVAVDILADLHLDQNRTIKFVTIGSPLYFLSFRSTWIKEEIKKCLANELIVSWIDFYSDEDWLCSKIPGHGEGNAANQKSIPIQHRASLLGKLKGETHIAYFSSQPVLERLVA